MTPPLVTAGITAYNAAETIEDALKSALLQDWPRLEIVVVDDCSTDETAAIVERMVHEHATPDRPIRLLRMPQNSGVASARNALLHAAAGEFLAFFDDDDVSRPERVTQQYARIVEAERGGYDLVLCYTARRQVFPEGRVHLEGTMGGGDVIPTGRAIVDRILIGRLSPGVVGSCATCSQMARLPVYQRLGGFDDRLRRSEDTDLNIRCGIAGGAIVGVADALVVQRMTVGAEKNLPAEFEAHAMLHDKYRSILEEMGWHEFTLGWNAVRRAHLESGSSRALALALLLGVRHPWKMINKLYWSLPAHGTRLRQKNWYRSAFQNPASPS